MQRKKAENLDLGQVGLWSMAARYNPDGHAAAVEVEQLGFKTLWVPGGLDSGVLEWLDTALEATSTLKFATGIINIWKHEPAEITAWWGRQSPARQQRLFLGIGVSHGPLIGEDWVQPIAKTRAFLDGLDSEILPPDRLCIAALGPQMLKLAAERTAGSHPYMVSARHSSFAREVMGSEAVLAPELGVVLETDAGRAREIARTMVAGYARLPNYANNWRRDGFSEADIAELSDRLIDDVIAWGDLDAIAARVDEHVTAGADHVCLQVIGPAGMGGDFAYERAKWRELAPLAKSA